MIKLLSCNRTTWGAAQTLGRAQAWWESCRKLGREADPQSHAAWTDKRWLDRKAHTVSVVLVLQLDSAEFCYTPHFVKRWSLSGGFLG